ncbi:helix-turn-helix domain-containing protein [Gordonia crocea]|uniref:RNA polymerase subunit sigma-70 n=1 Tax=Gordonia crocea TaxID=589162 RepID=A0A7I9V0P9_9ACTN|nr:helix-turn-helix domain-containing protein [Gordonia crocea]GED98640.1 hypothetical protein nbrc107697_26790 [Gordonia crocea]
MTEGTNPTADAVADKDPARGLAAVRALRTLADRLEDIHVDSAREAGWSWQQIADVLEISRQAVHQKHARRARPDADGSPTPATD